MIWDCRNKQQGKYAPFVRVVLLDGSELRDTIRIDTTTGEVTRLKRNEHGCHYVQHRDDCAVKNNSCLLLEPRLNNDCAMAQETIACPGVRVEPKASAPEFIKEEWPR